MGKRETRVIVVRKHTTVVLLVLVSAVMAGLLYYLSGRAYASASHPTLELMQRLLLRQGPAVSRQALLVKLIFTVLFGMLVYQLLTLFLREEPIEATRSKTAW